MTAIAEVYVRPTGFVIPTCRRTNYGVLFGDDPVDVVDINDIENAALIIIDRLTTPDLSIVDRNLLLHPPNAAILATSEKNWKSFSTNSGLISYEFDQNRVCVMYIKRIDAKGKIGYEPKIFGYINLSLEDTIKSLQTISTIIMS